MNLKIKTILILCLITLSSYSQQEELLPKITNPSPESYTMTKYGDLPMNEFNGAVSYSLPLLNFKALNIELPISLNYSGAGVKVDDIHSWTGVNFTLSAGGVITRTIKDLPDEFAGPNRVVLNDTQIETLKVDNEDGTAKAAQLRSFVENSILDTQVDLFQFNFAGYSGSFYINQGLNAVIVKDDSPLKINISDLASNNIIKITTPDGITYEFGGSGAIEETTTRYISGNSGSQVSDTFQGITAYYIKSIHHPLSGYVYFEYTTNLGIKIIPQKEIHKIRKVVNYFPANQYCVSDESGVALACGNMLQNLSDVTTVTTVSSRILDPKYLQRIYSPNTGKEIIFESVPLNNRFIKRKLNRIVYRQINSSTPIQTIDFTYLGQTTVQFSGQGGGYTDTSKRLFLEKVTFNKDNIDAPNTQLGRHNEVFTFEYESPGSLPSIFSYAQDSYGYYNGKEQNLSPLPNNIFFNPNNNIGFADKTPDFEFAVYGALKRIYFPTGGYTEFDYESGKAKKEKYNTIFMNVNRNVEGLPDTFSNGIPRIEYDGNVNQINNLSQDITTDIIVNLNATGSHTAIIPQNERVTIKVFKIMSNGSQIELFTRLIAMPYSPAATSASINETIPFTFLAYTNYRITVVIDEPTAYSTQNPFEVIASVSFFDGYEEVEGLGVRLKRQTEYAVDGQPEKIKRYYYNPITNLIPTFENLPLLENLTPVRTESGVFNAICNVNMACVDTGSATEIYYYFSYLLSDTMNFNAGETIDNYEKVTISYGGDNFEKGGVEKTFQVNGDNNGTLEIPTHLPSTGNSMTDHKSIFNLSDFGVTIPSSLNGTLLKEKYFIKDNSILKKSSEKTYVYDNSELHHMNNIFGQKLYEMLYFASGTNYGNIASNYYLGHYKISSRKNELLSVETKEYVEPIPFNSQDDESNYRKIVATQQYEYGTLRGLPTKIISSTDNNTEITEVFNKYSIDANTLSNLNAAQLLSYNKLTTLNRVSQPIQIEKFKNGELISKQRTLYKQFGNNVNNVQPEIIQTAKNSQPLEDRVIFSSYDPFGNPTLFGYKNGTKTLYNYNSNGQVFLKVENYIENSSSGGTIDNLPIIESQPCDLFAQYPNSFMTLFNYDYVTNILTSTIDSNCKTTYYEYNGLRQLIRIRDNENKILQEFEQNYKRY